ncbi:hypothetical protein Tco_0261262 [Tanacetum coccineum]
MQVWRKSSAAKVEKEETTELSDSRNLLPPLPKHNNILRLVGFSAVQWASGTKFVSSGFGNLVRWWDLRRNGGAGPVSQSP